jgi:CubicO group peptidase (beta-lactamase class C family)
VIERVAGKSWGAFVRERILTPLGMTRTNTSIRDNKDNVALPHNESGGKLRVLKPGNVDSAASAAGLNASVKDLSQWLRLQLGRGQIDGKQIFSKERSAEMWSQNTILGVNPFPAKDAPTQMFAGYGLGWFMNDYRGHKLLSHSGGLDGMISETGIMPDLGLGLVVLTNSETSVNTIMQNKILDVFLGVAPKRDWSGERLERAKQAKVQTAAADKKIEDARNAETKPSLALENYAGTYSSEMYGDVTITEENGKLVLRLVPAPNFVADLEHWEKDKFQIHWRPSVPYNFPRGFVIFTLDKTGKPAELKIDQPNGDFWFYELELKRSK